MPEWIAELQFGQIAAFVVFIGGVAIGGWKIFQFIRPAVKGITDITTDLRGEPERLDAAGQQIEPARPGALSRISAVEASQEETAKVLAYLVPLVERIHHETTPNHGGSMNDGLKRIEARQAETDRKLTEHIDIAKKSDERLAAVETELKKEG